MVLTKLAGTQDLRSIGSGNIGATNVLRTGRKGLAAATLIGDMLKGTIAVIIAGYYGGANAAMLAALGAFLGHLFPVWLKFNGGKGVATYIGVLIGLFWPAAADVLPDLARDRLHHALLVALGAGRSLRHAAVPVVVRPPGAGLAVRRADAAACSGSTAKTSSGCRRAPKGGSGRRDIGNRSPDERSDIRDGVGLFPDVASLIRATGSCPASASSTNRAAASASASAPYRAITCTPTGRSAVRDQRGNIDAGHAHQRPQPVVTGVAGRVQSLGRSARRRQGQQHIDLVEYFRQRSAARGSRRPWPRHSRPVSRPCSRRAGRAAAAPSRRNSRGIPRRAPDAPRIPGSPDGRATPPQ